MNKRGLKLQMGSLDDTLKKSPIKQQSEDEGNRQSPSGSRSEDEDQPPGKHEYYQHQYVEFEQFNIDPNSSGMKDTKRRIQTDYDKSYIPKSSGRMNKEAFQDQSGLTSQDSYRRGGADNLVRQLEACKKELMIKNGQISMLQRLINQHLGKGFMRNKQYGNCNWDDTQRVLSQKDARLSQYVQKISQLTEQMKAKNQQLAKYKYENYKLQGAVENLENQIYILKNREENNRLTRDFYLKKQFGNQNQTKPNSFWEDDARPSIKPDGYVRNIDDLQKRLDLLKQNRIQLERSKSRNKGKTARESTNDIRQQSNWMSPTVKHKPRSNYEYHLPRQRYQQTFVEHRRKKQTH